MATDTVQGSCAIALRLIVLLKTAETVQRSPDRGLHQMQADIFTPLKGILAKAWVLWELVVLAEPLMICAPTPGLSNAAEIP